jgi:hypothetical protein
MELDFSEQILAKKRPGPKSSAQTPAKPEDRLKGSPKNEPGSAGTKPDAKEKAKMVLERKDEKKVVKAAITFSDKVTKALKNKVEMHNNKHSRKVTLSQLKKVYRRGAGAFSASSRPGKSRGQWAMARVNTFLRMMAGGKVKDSYRAADQDIAKASDNNVKTLSQRSLASIDFDEYELVIAASDLVKSNVSLAEMDEMYESEDEEEYNEMSEAEKKTLNKPFRLPSGSKKKFGVYVKNEKGNVVMVKFGDPNMEIKRDDPERRKNFRARHQCDTNPGPKWKARYWSCRMWESGKSVTDYTKGQMMMNSLPIAQEMEMEDEMDMPDQEDLMEMNPELKNAPEVDENMEEIKEYSEESVEMSMAALSSVKMKAEELVVAMQSNEKIAIGATEPWVASKITLIDDYINSIYNYLMFSEKGEKED